MNKSRPTLWQRLKQLFSVTDALAGTDSDTEVVTHASASPPSPSVTVTNRAVNDTALGQTLTTAMTADTLTQPMDSESGSEPDWLIEPPITVGDIESMLAQLGYEFVYHPVQPQDEQHIHHFTMQVSDKAHEWGCMVRYLAQQQLMAVYSILPFPVPENHRADMLAVISYLNYDLVIGNLEMDLQDGELRFKTSLDLEVTGVNELVLSYLLQSNFSLVSRLYETLEKVVKKPEPTGDLYKAVNELITAQAEHTYYLMSDAIQ